MSGTTVISNELIKAAYALSVNEKRLVMFALTESPAVKPGEVSRIPVAECAQLYKMSISSAGRRLSAAMNELWHRELVLPSDKGMGLRWIISRSRYDEETLKLAFHPDLAPHLPDLKKHFTQHYLEHAADFRLVYSWRIFQMLIQYKSTGHRTMTVDEFKQQLELSTYYDGGFERLRHKVIEPSIDEIINKTGLHVEWRGVALKGRKIERLEFTFSGDQQAILSSRKSVQHNTAQRTPEQAVVAEQAAELAGLQRLAELSGQPLDTFLPKRSKGS